MSEMTGVIFFCVFVYACMQEMKDQLSSPSAMAQAEKKNRQVGNQIKDKLSIYTNINTLPGLGSFFMNILGFKLCKHSDVWWIIKTERYLTDLLQENREISAILDDVVE